MDLSLKTEKLITSLEQITEAMGASYEIDELFMIVVEAVTSVMDAERSTLYLIDHENSEIWSKVAQGSEITEIRLPIGKGVAGWVAENGVPALLHDAYQDARFNQETDRKTGFQTRNMLVQPILDKNGETIGVIQVLNKFTGTFDNEDQRLLAIIAQQTATGLTLSNLYTETLRRYEELKLIRKELEIKADEQEVLYEIEKAISNATDIRSLIEGILIQTVHVLGAGAGEVLMKDGRRSDLYFLPMENGEPGDMKMLRLNPGQGIIGAVAKNGETVISNSPGTDARHDEKLAKQIEFETESVLCVPLKSSSEILGALEILNKRGGFNNNDVKLISLIAGQASRAIKLFIDRSKEEQERRFSTIGQMLSAVLHDIKTPLTIISGYVQLMSMEDSAEKREEYVEEVLRQFDLLNRMTKELLAFVKGKRTVLPVKVSLSDFIEEITSDLTREFANTGVLLRIDAKYKDAARFDPDKMKRVVYNIASNAREAMLDGGDFKWAISLIDNYLTFDFTDTGIGISPEVLEKLFKPFASFGKEAGTGLGLVIAHNIIQEHDGEITIQSKPGEGATVTVKIPMSAAVNGEANSGG